MPLGIAIRNGGIGKTSLAVKIAEQVQDEFKFVIWRSLRNAPPIKDLLTKASSIFFCSARSRSARQFRASDLAVDGLFAFLTLFVAAR